MIAEAQAVERTWQRHYLARPTQAGLGGVAPVLPCIITHPPWARDGALAGPSIPEVRGYCCVDTGTKFSCIDVAAMGALGIEQVGTTKLQGMTSTEPANVPVFGAMLTFPGSNVEPLILADFIGVNLEWGGGTPEIPGKPIIALMGRAALVNYVMVYNGPVSTITLWRQ
jgi:hypothetical protein